MGVLLRRLGKVLGLVVILLAGGAAKEPLSSVLGQLSPDTARKITEDRDVYVVAKLKDGTDYSYRAVMLVRASVHETRAVLTNYALYAKMIPYVERVDVFPGQNKIFLRGGLWRFVLESTVEFKEMSAPPGEGWLTYTVVGGHFYGMKGNIRFQPFGPSGEKGTLVLFDGQLVGKDWPPQFLIERGAEFVFGFTGSRMRAYIQETKAGAAGVTYDRNIPQPRSRIE